MLIDVPLDSRRNEVLRKSQTVWETGRSDSSNNRSDEVIYSDSSDAFPSQRQHALNRDLGRESDYLVELTEGEALAAAGDELREGIEVKGGEGTAGDGEDMEPAAEEGEEESAE
ncbi:hypothetical protein MLD38_012393 [Melastoma candidum]|uniref:Uncharacterized protein n=1 Tax=Melastoma candidum TaxID=119954 RepID=A0ACB9R994_9MYRT|nr:hypothetical protein MLD38_012393 [Melastoma candidum]